MPESLEEKVKGPTPVNAFAVGAIAGGIVQYFWPSAGLAYRAITSLFVGAVAPLIDKVFYRTPLRKLYRNTPAYSLGMFTGQSLVSYVT